jgi:hypothetical protein
MIVEREGKGVEKKEGDQMYKFMKCEERVV